MERKVGGGDLALVLPKGRRGGGFCQMEQTTTHSFRKKERNEGKKRSREGKGSEAEQRDPLRETHTHTHRAER